MEPMPSSSETHEDQTIFAKMETAVTLSVKCDFIKSVLVMKKHNATKLWKTST